MTPAARLQAVIELLDLVDGTREPADRIAEQYFRARRYAGSRDRRAVIDRLYRLIRVRAQTDWVLLEAGGTEVSARLRAMAALLVFDRLESDRIVALFGAGGYGPTPLDGAERGLLAALEAALSEGRLALEGAPLQVRLNLPGWLEAPLRARFGEALESELGALNTEATVDLRANTLKTNRDRVVRRLANDAIAAAPCPLAPDGVRIRSRVHLRALALYRQGHIEPQDEGSQIVARAVGARPGMQVVDLCAGTGGKSLALAADMANSGQIHAFDAERRRLVRMEPRLKRAGVRNVQSHALDAAGEARLGALAGQAERVLIDAPCSGTGTWRRQPEARWRLSPAALEALTATQGALLDKGAGLVKPGGRLVYATCSVLIDENEAQVDAFLARAPEFYRAPLDLDIPGLDAADSGSLLLTPHRHGCDGFYLAALHRRPG